MKIVVFSDTHGDYADMLTVIEKENPDVVFHLGDFLRDLENVRYVYPDLPIYEVPGNCDWRIEQPTPDRRLISLDGVRFMLCHGHRFSVKSGYSSAVSAAMYQGADVLLCGHTHIPLYDEYSTLQLLNPGSVKTSHTYGIIQTQRGVAMCSIHPID